MKPPWTLEVLRGAAALRAALSAPRVAEWQALAHESKGVTVFQAPAFVLAWYEVYEPVWEPLLLLGRDESGALLAVLPLAMGRADGRLVFAGAEHSEYAGWLAVPSLAEEFPARAVGRLAELGLLPRRWDWGWLGPDTDLGWLEHPALRALGVTGRVTGSVTPVRHLGAGVEPRFFDPAKKNFKRKMNRLRTLGEVRLVPLTAETLDAATFERFTTLYDIRQLSRYGVTPFRADRFKATFHRRLLERAPETVAFFALVAGDVPVAFSFNMVDRRRAVYSMGPFDARWLAASPGKLIADLAAAALYARGIDRLDHTPGGDAYKEEAASGHETVHRLVLHSSRAQARAADAAASGYRFARRAALAVGLTPEHAERARALLGRGPWALAAAAGRAARRWTWSTDAVILYRTDREPWLAAEAKVPSPPDPFRKDALEDFLGYTGSIRHLSPQRMMAIAIERLAEGEHCYTLVEHGILVHFAWLQAGGAEMNLTEVGYRWPIPERSAIGYDVYSEPAARGRGLQRVSARARRRDAFAGGHEHFYSAVLESNRASRRNTELAGGRAVARIVRETRLGHRRWRTETLP